MEEEIKQVSSELADLATQYSNKPGEEKPTYIKHFFYGPKLNKTLPEKISNL